MSELHPFFWTFLASTVLAGALGAAGAHLAARQRTLQSLCLAQGAEIGALVSVLAAFYAHELLERESTWMSLGGSLAGALLAGLGAMKVSGGRASSRTSRLFGLWIVLIAVTHLCVAIHPALESHLARVFLGDLATLSDAEAIFVGVLGGTTLALLVTWHQAFARATFDAAALGRAETRGRFLEVLPFLVLPAASTWAAGFLFTCASLFLPTALLAASGMTSRRHAALCAVVGMVCAPLGLLVSLQFERMPTVPSMIALLAIGCVFVIFLRTVRRRKVLSTHRSKECR